MLGVNKRDGDGQSVKPTQTRLLSHVYDGALPQHSLVGKVVNCMHADLEQTQVTTR